MLATSWPWHSVPAPSTCQGDCSVGSAPPPGSQWPGSLAPDLWLLLPYHPPSHEDSGGRQERRPGPGSRPVPSSHSLRASNSQHLDQGGFCPGPTPRTGMPRAYGWRGQALAAAQAEKHLLKRGHEALLPGLCLPRLRPRKTSNPEVTRRPSAGAPRLQPGERLTGRPSGIQEAGQSTRRTDCVALWVGSREPPRASSSIGREGSKDPRCQSRATSVPEISQGAAQGPRVALLPHPSSVRSDEGQKKAQPRPGAEPKLHSAQSRSAEGAKLARQPLSEASRGAGQSCTGVLEEGTVLSSGLHVSALT